MIVTMEMSNIKPEFSFFQSCFCKEFRDFAPGLILGFELLGKGDDVFDSPFDLTFSSNSWELNYVVFGTSLRCCDMFHATEDKIKLTKEKFFQDVLLPKNEPLFTIGNIFKPATHSPGAWNYAITGCQWGKVDNSRRFTQGWNYMLCWINPDPTEEDYPWDSQGLYSEDGLIDFMKENSLVKV